jgi:hypothetical protein
MRSPDPELRCMFESALDRFHASTARNSWPRQIKSRASTRMLPVPACAWELEALTDLFANSEAQPSPSGKPHGKKASSPFLCRLERDRFCSHA